MADPLFRAFFDRDNLAQATAWFAPFPPELVEKELAESVSPPLGTREVKVVRSTFKEPIMVMMGGEVVEVIVEDVGR